MILFMDPGDSTRANTSRPSSCIAIFVGIKKGEDVIDSSSRNRLYNGL